MFRLVTVSARAELFRQNDVSRLSVFGSSCPEQASQGAQKARLALSKILRLYF